MKKIVFTTLLLIYSYTIFCQTYSHKEIYDNDFVFTEGLYIKKEDMVANLPIEKERISTNIPYEELTFFDQLTQNKTISIYDNLGMLTEIKTENIWGYCSGQNIYINFNGYFCKIGIIGKLCHFVGIKTVTTFNPQPYFGYNHWLYNNTTTSEHTEEQQYFMEFETGKIYEYNPTNLEMLLMSDPSLHDEYAALPRKKKSSGLFFYMRKFNEKHPLYLPVYE